MDDEPFNILGMQIKIDTIGINGLSKLVDRAYSGVEALKLVKEGLKSQDPEAQKYVYGLIITDISMPIMDGYELTKEIRNFYHVHNMAQPLIVACTGHVEETYIEKAWEYEIDEVIPKPVEQKLLEEVIRETIYLSSYN